MAVGALIAAIVLSEGRKSAPVVISCIVACASGWTWVTSALLRSDIRNGVRWAEAVNAVRHSPDPYVLLLRSFDETRSYRLTALTVSTDEWPGPDFSRPITMGVTDDVIDRVQAALKGRAWLFLAGDPSRGISIGHHRITLSVGADWLADVLSLARGAQAIIVIPGTTSGIVEELLTLRQGELLAKTLILIPPVRDVPVHEPVRAGGVAVRGLERSTWDAVVEKLATHRIFLTVTPSQGQLYRPDTEFSPTELSAPLNGDRPDWGLEPAFDILLPTLPPSYLSLAEMFAAAERLVPPVSLAWNKILSLETFLGSLLSAIVVVWVGIVFWVA